MRSIGGQIALGLAGAGLFSAAVLVFLVGPAIWILHRLSASASSDLGRNSRPHNHSTCRFPISVRGRRLLGHTARVAKAKSRDAGGCCFGGTA